MRDEQSNPIQGPDVRSRGYHAQAGVMVDVGAGLDVIGSPAQPSREFFRGVAALRKLARPQLRAGGEPTGEGSS